jgi:uncharacterized membrane protein
MTYPKRQKKKLEKIADTATKWIGSMASLLFHTILFIFFFILPLLGVELDSVLLILTTIASLEAIYLAIFIQMSVNKNTQDIEEIQEDVGIIQEDVEEIQKDVEDIEEDVDAIQKDVDEIQEDIEEIEEDSAEAIDAIQKILSELQKEIEQLKKK